MSDLVHSEWIKFRSLRGSWIRLAVAVALDLAVVVFALWFFNRSIGNTAPDTGHEARVNTLTGGISIAAILMIIVGVAVYTGEIKSRSIIPSITAVPNRRNSSAPRRSLSVSSDSSRAFSS
jgi:ABC-2 type transport system permease protein